MSLVTSFDKFNVNEEEIETPTPAPAEDPLAEPAASEEVKAEEPAAEEAPAEEEAAMYNYLLTAIKGRLQITKGKVPPKWKLLANNHNLPEEDEVGAEEVGADS